MPVVTKDQAVEMLTKEVEENLGADEILEVYNELFPEDPYTEKEVQEDSWPLIQGLVDYLNRGLETEEIVELWNLIFPEHRNVWYDEEEGKFHYSEEAEPLPAD